MSFEQFPSINYCQVFNTDDIIRMGSFQYPYNCEIGAIKVFIFITNSIQNITTERIRLKIFSDDTYRNIIYTSNWCDLSDIDSLNPLKDWVGKVNIDFNKENINKEIRYYLACEIDNYVYLEPNFIGLLYDFPNTIYDNAQSQFYRHPLAFEAYDWKRAVLDE